MKVDTIYMFRQQVWQGYWEERLHTESGAYPNWALRNQGANKVIHGRDKCPAWEVKVDGTGDVCNDCRKTRCRWKVASMGRGVVKNDNSTGVCIHGS